MTTSQQVDPLIGRLVDGRYRVRARIARGGMATVYVATDLRLERRVALKVMHSHLSDDSVFQSRFIQEARSTAGLSDPHVVNVFDQGQDGDLAYLVMEYLPGITLRQLLKEQSRLTISQTVTIMDAVLAGLAAAHRAGFIHRDVKPENVLLAEDGRIKIGDFGLARASSANTATGQQLLGTIAYLAPELVTRGTADARSDIYALGIMLYEMLAGEQPYRGEQPMQIAYQHATEQVPRPSIKNPAVPEQLDELVLWATEKEPDERPSDAGEMLRRLREIQRELGISPAQTAPTQSTTPLAAIAEQDTGGATKILPSPSALPATTGTVDTVDNAQRLSTRTRRRRTRGGWLLAVVLLLAALAAGAGWWWGSGPGSLIQVPDVSGLSYEEAQSALAEHGLAAVEASEPSLEVPAGQTIRTDPSSGEPVERETEVSVVVSTGPAPADVPALAGLSADQAHSALQDVNISVGDSQRIYSGDVDEDAIVSATITPASGGDAIECSSGCSAHEGDTARLTVSAGALPDVTGMSLSDARSDLSDAGLTVAEETVQWYSDDISEGSVIGIADREGGGAWQPGDTVTLIESLGPELFPIPDVVGMTRDEAKAAIEAEGFTASYNPLWDAVTDSFTEVTATHPGPGGELPRGGTIDLVITGSF